MNHQYKARSAGVFFLFCCAYLIIIANLFFIQIWHAPFFTQLGIQQYHVTVSRTPSRAPILDRNGNYLAMNKDCISAFIMPQQIKNAEVLSLFLQEYFPNAYQRFLQNKSKSFLYLKRKLSDQELEIIHQADLNDVHLLHETRRYYPLESAGPIIGLTDIDNNGVLGLELQNNKQLAGTPTQFNLEKDARSGYFYFSKETKLQGYDGSPIQLTLDSELQFLVEEELKKTIEHFQAKEVSALIMDPKTGEILTMVNLPHFNPNKTEHLSMEETKNRVVTDSYELGSVIKVFTALAALEENLVTLDEPFDCKNTKTTFLDGRRVNTVTAHGIIPFIDVIARSNNIGIAKVAKRLDTKLYDHFIKIGFGKKTNMGFPGEAAGFVNPPKKWSKQSIISLSYGYEISATLVQLAQAFCMIANEGHTVQPKLLTQQEINLSQAPLYKKESIDAVKKILTRTTQAGTSRYSAIKGYNIMCKTGTTNILINGKYCSQKNAYNCAGIVEKDGYQRVIVVFVKEIAQKNLFAQQVAAPLFERVARTMIIHERIV